MNQEKVGKFIVKLRKENNMTQQELANKLNITDRAVSHWENGRSMPDAGIMLELCKILNVNVNELLSAKKIPQETYSERAEENLLEMKREIESQNRRIFTLNKIIINLVVIIFIVIGLAATFIEMSMFIRNIIFAVDLVMLISVGFFTLNILQKTGCYECQECKYQYIPGYTQMFFGKSGITNTNWRMKCPKCKKKCWHKKVLTKSEKKK